MVRTITSKERDHRERAGTWLARARHVAAWARGSVGTRQRGHAAGWARGRVREAMGEVPAGFEPSRRTSPFLDMIGPVYTATTERGILLGLRARTEHLNTRGFVHGAI